MRPQGIERSVSFFSPFGEAENGKAPAGAGAWLELERTGFAYLVFTQALLAFDHSY